MGGLKNNVLFSENVRFDGQKGPGQVTSDGQLLIGSTASPNIRVGTLTGSDGITVTPGPGSINVAYTGNLTGSDGITITPGGGLINVSYTGSRVEQIVYSMLQTMVVCDSTMPYDDTIPQITEGDEFLTATITPKNANNLLVIDFSGFGASLIAFYNVIALFRDAQPDALAATCQNTEAFGAAPSITDNFCIKYCMLAGTTNPITFRMRGGNAIGGVPGGGLHINGGYDSGAGMMIQLFGGRAATTLTVTEFRS